MPPLVPNVPAIADGLVPAELLPLPPFELEEPPFPLSAPTAPVPTSDPLPIRLVS